MEEILTFCRGGGGGGGGGWGGVLVSLCTPIEGGEITAKIATVSFSYTLLWTAELGLIFAHNLNSACKTKGPIGPLF